MTSSDHTTERLDEELWQHAWYAFTEEWAWFRSRQDTVKDLGEMSKQTPAEKIDELVHERFHKKFESYVRELDMDTDAPERRMKQKKSKRK